MRRRRFSASALAAVVAALTACGGGSNNTASHSPTAGASPTASAPATPTATANPSPTPAPVTGAFGVLVSNQASGGQYTVSLVGIDGKVAASASANAPAIASCAGAAGAPVPLPVSSSNSRVYYMDASGAVYWLAPNGALSPAPIATLPMSTASRRSMFAVSPDDAEMAVVVADYTSTGATTKLYRYDLNKGGTQTEIYSETGAYTLWPIGWHGVNNMVVAKVVACTQGGGPFCCGPLELHVIDPATATRRFVIGNSSSCVISGSPSPAGAVCENNSSQATVLNWTAGTVRTLAINGPTLTYLSPDGGMVAFVDNSGTSFTLGAAPITGMFACSWIDSTHVLAGGDSQHQARMAEITTGTVIPVSAQGDCGGRLPGGL